MISSPEPKLRASGLQRKTVTSIVAQARFLRHGAKSAPEPKSAASAEEQQRERYAQERETDGICGKQKFS
jgi:hypothetical protein